MKWMPLTDSTLSQLRSKGYTRLVVKNITSGDDNETHKEFVTLEAIKGEAGEDVPSFDINAEAAETFLHSDAADYYVLFK